MNKKILIIEDDEDIREIISIVLSEKGLQTVFNLLDFDKISQEGFSLALIDLSLENGTTENLVQCLKASSLTKSIPIILVSGSSDLEEISSRLNADGFLKKPFNLVDLEGMVDRYLS